MFCEKGVLRNFAKLTGKHPRKILFFNKVAGLNPAALLKKRLWRRCFPVNFVKILSTPIDWYFNSYFTEKLYNDKVIKTVFNQVQKILLF